MPTAHQKISNGLFSSLLRIIIKLIGNFFYMIVELYDYELGHTVTTAPPLFIGALLDIFEMRHFEMRQYELGKNTQVQIETNLEQFKEPRGMSQLVLSQCEVSHLKNIE